MGLTELVLIGILAYLLFGSKKLSELGKSIGKAKKNFNESLTEIEVNNSDVTDDPELINRQNKFKK